MPVAVALEAEDCHERDGYGASWFALGKRQVGLSCHPEGFSGRCNGKQLMSCDMQLLQNH